MSSLEELESLLGVEPGGTNAVEENEAPSVRVIGQDEPLPSTKINSVKDDKFDSLYQRIKNLRREDYAVPAKQLGVGLQDNRIVFGAGDEFAWNTTPYAVDQLSDRLSKGLRSFGHELDERGHRDLRVQVINEMLQRESDDRKYQVRTIQPNGQRLARAVVSDAFKPIDDNILIDPMVELVGDRSKEWRALGGQITDTHTRIKYITREPQIYNIGPNNRDWHIGFMYRNSEVGASSVVFAVFVFDAFCENGCVFGSQDLVKVNIQHKGARISSDFGLIAENRVLQAEQLAIQESIGNATKELLGKDFEPKIRRLVEQNMARKIEGNAATTQKAIKQVANFAGLTKTEQDNVAAYWDSKEPTAFGVSSAITRLAQETDDYESRVRLESAGGKVLEMPDNRWKSVMALAN